MKVIYMNCRNSLKVVTDLSNDFKRTNNKEMNQKGYAVHLENKNLKKCGSLLV